MSEDIIEVIRAVVVRKPVFSASEIRKRTGTSLSGTWKQLRKLVDSGYLVKRGSGSGARYALANRRRGDLDHLGFGPGSFWERLARAVESFGYVQLGQLGGAIKTRKQLRLVIEPYEFSRFLVIDFRGIERIADVVAYDLICTWPTDAWCHDPMLINTCPDVELALRRAELQREKKLRTIPF